VSEEIFDVVNDRDEVIGQAPRAQVHARSLNHRAVHVLIWNARGDIFLQKRSMQKDCSPGAWDSSASGHLDRGEAYDACAIREVREELGIQLPGTPERLFKIDAGPDTGFEFCWVYRATHEGPFTLHPDEIETGAWFSADRVDAWTAERPNEFAGAFLSIWREWRSQGAAGSPH